MELKFYEEIINNFIVFCRLSEWNAIRDNYLNEAINESNSDAKIEFYNFGEKLVAVKNSKGI